MKKNNAIKVAVGIVIEGRKKGRILGFPTANIALCKKLESGVYSGKAYFDRQEYYAAIFIPENGKMLEAHILDFEGDLYGKKIEVKVFEKLRETKKFNSEDDLKRQIREDIDKIMKL